MTVVDFPLQGTIGTSVKPKRYDIEVYQGDDFDLTLVFRDAANALINVTGWTVLAEIEDLAAPTTPPTGAFSSTVGGANGEITISLSSIQLEALPAAEYKYDVQVTDNAGKKRTYIGGKLIVTEDISE